MTSSREPRRAGAEPSSPSGGDRLGRPPIMFERNAPPLFVHRALDQEVIVQITKQSLVAKHPQSHAPAFSPIKAQKRRINLAGFFGRRRVVILAFHKFSLAAGLAPLQRIAVNQTNVCRKSCLLAPRTHPVQGKGRTARRPSRLVPCPVVAYSTRISRAGCLLPNR